MSQTLVKASGLTCQHCALSVREELEEIENISGVEVEVVKDGDSTITISHEGDLDQDAVTAAIEEAGYSRVG